MSTAYHPQTDGQSEVLNRCLETYLRCFIGERPGTWAKWLHWAEYSYNTAYHYAANTSLFEAVYGRSSPSIIRHLPGECPLTIARRSCPKLAPRFFGPFEVLGQIGAITYRLRLPEASQIHPVFHVSQLRRVIGYHPTLDHIPSNLDFSESAPLYPVAILDTRSPHSGTGVPEEVRVAWRHRPPSANTWLLCDDFRRQFPDFCLEDKENFPDGGIVTKLHDGEPPWRVYARWPRSQDKGDVTNTGSPDNNGRNNDGGSAAVPPDDTVCDIGSGSTPAGASPHLAYISDNCRHGGGDIYGFDPMQKDDELGYALQAIVHEGRNHEVRELIKNAGLELRLSALPQLLAATFCLVVAPSCYFLPCHGSLAPILAAATRIAAVFLPHSPIRRDLLTQLPAVSSCNYLLSLAAAEGSLTALLLFCPCAYSPARCCLPPDRTYFLLFAAISPVLLAARESFMASTDASSLPARVATPP
ncbi:hypothetical protein KSP39_PZI013044 [Platanthera zijinensis]|uniref:Tf2-1-like SH3-like domain-containing protein n=1 Tax=Platanthera zijinensis TaxID=2320716 RepID=A0AAP0BDU0_9ASPA